MPHAKIVRDRFTCTSTIGRISGLTAQTILEQLALVFVSLGAWVCILWPQSGVASSSHVPERPMVKVVNIITGNSRKK